MSYRRGSSSSYYKISTGDQFVPAGVVIGRQGCTIKAMQQISGAQIRIRDNEVQVRGGQKQVATAKGLLTELKNNYSRGVIGLTSTVRPKKVRKRIHIRTDTSSGWSKVEANKTEETVVKSEPKKVKFAFANHFNGLDFDSDSDESAAGDEQIITAPKEEFPALPSSPAIKLTIREKPVQSDDEVIKHHIEKPVRRRWADICDDESDDDDDDEGLFLQSC